MKGSIIRTKKKVVTMIKNDFLMPAEIWMNNFKTVKKRLKILEKYLRLLGNYQYDDIIDVIESKYEEETNDIIYKTIDYSGNIFEFYNYTTEAEVKRFRKNYSFTMQKKDSDIKYVYEFASLHPYQLRLKKIILLLKNQTTFTVKIDLDSKYLSYEINDGNKTYLVSFNKSKSEKSLQNLEEIIENAKHLSTINLENSISLVPIEDIWFCKIQKDSEEKGTIYFENGNICTYIITENNKTINTTINDKITREVSRDGYSPYKEEITKNYEKVQDDIKRLMKIL